MADFKTVMVQAAMMCKSHKTCESCPVSKHRVTNCRVFIFDHPDEFEEIILKWAAEHSIVTNGNKFKEVFGYDMTERFNTAPSMKDWLDAEYEKPEE